MLRTQAAVLVLLLAFCSLSQAESPGAQKIYSSGQQHVALIELYTSEGCSSCPPADRWLSGLKNDGGLWKDYVPIAFHVDYWDYIGWKDRFSRRAFSDRQRRYADEGGTRVVYTPGFFRHGQDWRGWRNGMPGKTETPHAGKLIVSVDRQNAEIRFDDLQSNPRQLTANIALLGMSRESTVLAGENKGRKLQHDFVVLEMSSVPLSRSASTYKAKAQLPGATSNNEELALAVWVSEKGNQAPIQSAGGYLSAKHP